MVLLLAGCGSDGGGDTTSQEAAPTKPKPKPKKRARPSYLASFEKAVRSQETLYIRAQGYEISGPADVEVRCDDTKVKRGAKLASGCEVHSFATKTGSIIDAEELPVRHYEVQYDPNNPSDFKALPPP